MQGYASLTKTDTDYLLTRRSAVVYVASRSCGLDPGCRQTRRGLLRSKNLFEFCQQRGVGFD